MATQDKVMLMYRIEGTLRPRMFANLLDESIEEINGHLDEFDVKHISGSGEADETDDMLTTYIEAKRTEGRSEKTLVRYQYVIEKFMKFCGCSTRDVTTYHIRDYLAKEQARGVKDTTLEGIRQVFSGYFGWLEHEKLIPMNPVFNVGAIKCEKMVKEAYSDAEIERLKRSCIDIRDMAIVCFLLSTGCRVSEMTGLDIDDIDFNASECVVNGKGKKQRTVYLDEIAVMTIKEYLSRRTDNEKALFVGYFGERLQPGGVRIMLKALGKRAKVTNVHPHRFRRTFITKLLNRGMPIQEVALVVGHDKMDTTMRYFSASNARIKSSFQKYYN